MSDELTATPRNQQRQTRDDLDTSSADSDPLVVVDGLRTYYESDALIGGSPVKAVDGVSFDIERGETLGIVGESGCGKTTLGRSILRLEEPTEGRVLFDGTDLTTLQGRQLQQWRQHAQIVLQNPTSSINERMTVGRIVREPLDVHNWQSPSERRERVFDLLETVGLESEHYYRYPHQFSGGQRQRVGIARALALQPEFLVLDEPVSALDVSVQAKILNLLMDLQAEFDLTYLLIAHDLSVVRHVCDRVGVMYLGKIMELGPTEDLFQSPANPYTHSLLSAIPQPDPSAGTNRITLRGTPPSPRHPPTGCVFSTRCPFKIRPAEHDDIGDQEWERIEAFRDILRERDQADITVVERLKGRLGLETRFTPLEEVVSELFEDVSYAAPIEDDLEEATTLACAGDISEARASLTRAFGSVCETDRPTPHAVADQRVSRCHRHLEEYADPDDVLEHEHEHEQP